MAVTQGVPFNISPYGIPVAQILAPNQMVLILNNTKGRTGKFQRAGHYNALERLRFAAAPHHAGRIASLPPADNKIGRQLPVRQPLV